MVRIVMLFLFTIGTVSAVDVIPLLQYEKISLDHQGAKISSVGMVIQDPQMLFVGLYGNTKLEKQLENNFPQDYHSFDILYQKDDDKGQFVSVLKTESDQPVYGGFNTFQAATVYGWNLAKSDRFRMILGGGLGISDFGIELSNGNTWPLLPLPFFRIKYSSSLFEFSFDFITGPSFNFVLAPKSSLRFISDLRMDQMRDARDLIFNLSLAYRFSASGNEFGGISIGLKNDNLGAFELGRDKDDNVEFHYYSLFCELDLALLKISYGYAFKGRALYLEETKEDLGHGSFFSIQGLYKF